MHVRDEVHFHANSASGANESEFCFPLACGGGAIEVAGTSVLFMEGLSTMTRNIASYLGGAILALDESTVVVASLIAHNKASQHGGAIASVGRAAVSLESGTLLRRNQAGLDGGGLYVSGASLSAGKS